MSKSFCEADLNISGYALSLSLTLLACFISVLFLVSFSRLLVDEYKHNSVNNEIGKQSSRSFSSSARSPRAWEKTKVVWASGSTVALCFSAAIFICRCLIEAVWMTLEFTGYKQSALILQVISTPLLAASGWCICIYLTIALDAVFHDSVYRVSSTRLFAYQYVFSFACICWVLNIVLWLCGVISAAIGIPLVVANTMLCAAFILGFCTEFIKRLFGVLRAAKDGFTRHVEKHTLEMSSDLNVICLQLETTEKTGTEVEIEMNARMKVMRDLSALKPEIRRMFKFAAKLNVLTVAMMFSCIAVPVTMGFMFSVPRDSNCAALASTLGTYSMGAFCISGGLAFKCCENT